MTPQARIKARFAEEAAAAGVQLSITARKSNATEYTAHLFEGRIFYLIIRGEYPAMVKFRRSSGLDLQQMTSGASFESTWNLQPHDIGRVMTETAVDSAWLHWNGSAPLRIASEIRDKKTFDQLPVLADALEEAGCTNEHLLRHCRAGVAHEGTCWVVEVLVGMGRAGSKNRASTGEE